MQDVYSSYAWQSGSFNSTPSKSVLELIEQEREKFLQVGSEGTSETFATLATEYFPHVTKDSLEQGFYKRFGRLQGQRGLYYATTLLDFESMEHALKMSDDFVRKYF